MVLHNICSKANLSSDVCSTEPGYADQAKPTYKTKKAGRRCPVMNLNCHYVEVQDGSGMSEQLVDTVIPRDLMPRGRRRDLEMCPRRDQISHDLHWAGKVRPGFSKYGKSTRSLRKRAAVAAEIRGQ